jgi:hypothetical protein
MEPDVQAKLDQVEQQLIAVNSRFDDMKSTLSNLITFFGIVIGAFTLLTGLMFKDQNDLGNELSGRLSDSLKEQKGEVDTATAKVVSDTDKAIDRADQRDNNLLTFTSGTLARSSEEVTHHIEKDDERIRDFESDVDSKLGQGYGDPKLELLGPDNRPLEGGELEGTFDHNYCSTRNTIGCIHFEVRLRNSGSGSSGPIFFRVYSSKIHFPQKSPDADAGKYSATLYPNVIQDNTLSLGAGLPGGGFTSIAPYNLDVAETVSPGQYDLLIKCFYGSHKSGVAEAKAVLVIR